MKSKKSLCDVKTNPVKTPLNIARSREDLVPSPGVKVLLVDDYSTMRRIIRSLLQQIGIAEVTEASDGSTALGKLREHAFDIVISDWNMEPMSGLQLLKEIRADNKLTKLPFIMVTAETKTENVAAAKAAGVSNYIVKPFTAATLKQKMEAVLGALGREGSAVSR
jgi:two-component system, chemotaxis family, chemotaxis protein CheY